MHYSEILIELDSQFAPQYVTPAQMKEIYESDCDSGGADVSIEEVTHEFSYLVKHNILINVDGDNSSLDPPHQRFELSQHWCGLSEEEQDGWYNLISSSNDPIPLTPS